MTNEVEMIEVIGTAPEPREPAMSGREASVTFEGSISMASGSFSIVEINHLGEPS